MPTTKGTSTGRATAARRTRSSRNWGRCSTPNTGFCYESETETDIEHIVALQEAHHSGMCFADTETKRTFAGDLLNLTVAAPGVNQEESSQDAGDWMPELNRCWFSQRVLDVKLKYDMTVDVAEAEALELVLAACPSVELVEPECAG